MILSSLVNEEALISNNQFLVGSILHADELSITVVPAAANFGPLNDVSPHSKQTISGCIATAVANPTYTDFTIKVSLYPLTSLKLQELIHQYPIKIFSLLLST
jgi:hypothetical protein